jgi:repressor LexA
MANRDQLTNRQREVYDFIRDKIFARGYGPTVREIGLGFGIRSPNGVMCHLRALEKKGLIRREPNMSRAIQLVGEQPTDTDLPLAGRIAAGRPLEAVEQSDRINFSGLFESNDHFALEVTGDSMIDDHIADGDYVIVRRQPTARDGQIVVALLDDGEATLKRWFPEKGRVRLEPANATMKPIYATRARVLGVVVGVVRKYAK